MRSHQYIQELLLFEEQCWTVAIVDRIEAHMIFQDTGRWIVSQENYQRSSFKVKNHADHLECCKVTYLASNIIRVQDFTPLMPSKYSI